ncbi:hypothetical protein VTI74DRAFT_2842 [Chaetomium olivicolor]
MCAPSGTTSFPLLCSSFRSLFSPLPSKAYERRCYGPEWRGSLDALAVLDGGGPIALGVQGLLCSSVQLGKTAEEDERRLPGSQAVAADCQCWVVNYVSVATWSREREGKTTRQQDFTSAQLSSFFFFCAQAQLGGGIGWMTTGRMRWKKCRWLGSTWTRQSSPGGLLTFSCCRQAKFGRVKSAKQDPKGAEETNRVLH